MKERGRKVQAGLCLEVNEKLLGSTCADTVFVLSFNSTRLDLDGVLDEQPALVLQQATFIIFKSQD
jgi:hypothetical protein